MVLAVIYCLGSLLFLPNTLVPCCLTIVRDDNSTGPVCALKGAMHPVHQNLKFKETWLVIYQMKENTDVHHLN